MRNRPQSRSPSQSQSRSRSQPRLHLRGSALAELLMAIVGFVLLAGVCVTGVTTALQVVTSARARIEADTIADGAAQFMMDTLRFAPDPDSALQAAARLENMANETNPSTGVVSDMDDVRDVKIAVDDDGNVRISFRVGDFLYEYTTRVLNWSPRGTA